jgi:hypothetical protein
MSACVDPPIVAVFGDVGCYAAKSFSIKCWLKTQPHVFIEEGRPKPAGEDSR